MDKGMEQRKTDKPEPEKNRMLWIIFSIGLFLAVVLAGGLYLLRPQPEPRAEAAPTAPSVQGFDTFEYVRGRSELPGLEPRTAKPEETVIVIGEKEPAQEKPEIREPLPRVPARTGEPSSRPAAKPVAGVAAVKPEKPAPRTIAEYWIQTGSYKSASRAQAVMQTLSEKGLAAHLTTRELEGQTYYRVRIGPYARKEEADKFLSWVKALEGFEASYLSMVYAKRSSP